MTEKWFTIQQVTSSADAPALAAVGAKIPQNDRHTMLKDLGVKSHQPVTATTSTVDPDPAAGMSASLARWLPLPQKYSVMKAVADVDGKTLGWVCWGTRRADEVVVNTTHGQVATQGAGEDDPIVRLEALTGDDLRAWMDRFMPPGTNCMYVVGLVVDPEYHGRGVGSALLRWGTERADREGMFCWVHSSEGGWGAFAKNGFDVVGTLDIDLDEYAGRSGPCPESDDGKWGHYVFRYMKRMSIQI